MKTRQRMMKWFSCFAVTIGLSVSFMMPPVYAFTGRNLAYGSQGYDVDELQSRLHLLGYYWGAVDGNFDWDTYWAVRTFQYNMGMKATGLLDMPTKMRLVNSTANWRSEPVTVSKDHGATVHNVRTTTSSTGNRHSSTQSAFPAVANGLSAADLNLMAHVVYGEARGEGVTGEVAIAAVILNRLKDPRFPHTVSSIVYQPGAFTAVQDGQVNLQPDAQAKRAVMQAVHGQDPVMDAVYYFNPATATSHWIWSRPQILTLGHHIFCV